VLIREDAVAHTMDCTLHPVECNVEPSELELCALFAVLFPLRYCAHAPL
jgi:hypothetical protein